MVNRQSVSLDRRGLWLLGEVLDCLLECEVRLHVSLQGAQHAELCHVRTIVSPIPPVRVVGVCCKIMGAPGSGNCAASETVRLVFTCNVVIEVIWSRSMNRMPRGTATTMPSNRSAT